MADSPADNGGGPRRRGGPTLRDIAREAGVHVSTVSRILNGQAAAGRITPQTEERIREIAERLGYRRNTVARALRTRRTLVVGMVVPDVSNLHQAGITRAAGDALTEGGYSLLLASSGDDLERARSQVAAMLGAQVDGLLYGVAREEDPVLRRVVDSGTPVVLFNRGAGDLPSVLPDDGLGIRQAVEHLLELGHRRIVYVGGAEDVASNINRMAAFDSVLAEAALEGGHALAGRFTEEEGSRVMAQLLEGGAEMTAVVAGNDRLALGVIDAIGDAGLACPGDISVVGFNDMPYADRVSPPLTTVRVPIHDVGHRAASLLLDLIGNPQAAPRHILVQPQLVRRDSTGPPASRSR
ncbi:MAG: LacI family DNA-binding transcriptional regulator [Actinomycetota bacterium]